LDATNLFEEKQTKRSVLRIKPLVMKRLCRSMSIKRKKNSDEVQHVEKPRETLVSFLLHMKLRFSNLTLFLHMKLKKQLVSMMKNLNVIPILWITKEIMSRGPQVADMECRETT
jgi:hypothetical protein